MILSTSSPSMPPPPPLNVLICGGGCAGPALALLLARHGHQVTVVERASALRASGAQIDLRAQGIDAIKRMGLFNAIRDILVDEQGSCLLDSAGTAIATVLANKSGHGPQSFTSEFEIMRGDLVRLLYARTKDLVEYRFGMTVRSFDQDEVEKKVVAHFSDGSSGSYDLLVGADGQGSRVREAMLPPDAPDVYRHMSMHMAYFFVPRTPKDGNLFSAYHAPGGRVVFTRSHNATETQVYFGLRDDSAATRRIHRAPVEEQKAFWARTFRGAGWEVERFLEGMQGAENFYSVEIVQVQTESWHRGRVVLLGDAAYCPSPASAMGTTGAFVGVCVLAGEIVRHSDDLAVAFKNYEEVMRPFVKDIQKLSPAVFKVGIPETWLGIAVLRFVVGVLCFLRIPQILMRFAPEENSGWRIPEYPEAGLTST